MQTAQEEGRRTCVLVVEDDRELAREVIDYMSRYGFRCVGTEGWEETLLAIGTEKPDAIILDQWLGSVDTLQHLTELRQTFRAPVLILTSNREEADRVVGLELGADDFLCKPVSGRELVARVRAQLRARQQAGASGWSVDSHARRVLRPGGGEVALTASEFDVLRALMEAPGSAISREELSRAGFRRPWHPGDRAVDAAIASLRAKLDGDADRSCILTVRNLGYQFAGFIG